MHDRENTQRLFKQATLGGRVWTVWSVYFDLPGNILQLVKAELDQMLVDYPTQFVVTGAWHWDGRQVGTEWTDETQTATTGTPVYPMHPQILKFMPDVDGLPATVVTDVNVGFGQSLRRFV